MSDVLVYYQMILLGFTAQGGLDRESHAFLDLANVIAKVTRERVPLRSVAFAVLTF